MDRGWNTRSLIIQIPNHYQEAWNENQEEEDITHYNLQVSFNRKILLNSNQNFVQVHICFCLLFMMSISIFISIYHILKLSMLLLLSLAMSSSLPSYLPPSILPWPCNNMLLLTPAILLLFLQDRRQEHIAR